MNNRDYKQFAPGEYYHFYNRGNAKMDIFRDKEDYQLFLSRLIEAVYPNRPSLVNGAHSQQRNQRKPLPAKAFSLVAYCLMPNHFHLLVRQNTELAGSALILKVCGSYSKLFNKKYNRVGTLFQDQFKAVSVGSDQYLKWLSAYIHQNPAVAKLVADAQEYPYSSYQEYLGNSETSLCEKDTVMGDFAHPDQYKNFVSDSFESIYNKKELSHLLVD